MYLNNSKKFYVVQKSYEIYIIMEVTKNLQILFFKYDTDDGYCTEVS